jgi:hypothetical protein
VDVRRFKNPAPRLATWPGATLGGSCAGTVELRALPQSEIEQAEQLAAELMRVRGCEPKRGPVLELLERGCVLAAALGTTFEILAEAADGPTISRLWGEQRCLQRSTYPQSDEEMQALEETIRRRTARAVTDHAREGDTDVFYDAKAAHLSQSPTDFYGQPVSALTEGQVLYWTLARAAFREFHTDDGKHVSKQWLLSE